jgi:hypothetical protein
MNMSHKENADDAAAALVKKRWDKTPAKDRTEHARKMAAARWAGHEAKRPAASRKKPTRKKSAK